MSFEWSSTGIGQIIKALHLTELHDNIDSIKDNLACISDKSSDNNTYNSGVDSSYNTSVDSPHKSGVDSGYKYGVDSSYRSSVHSGADSSVNSSYDSGVDGTYKGSVYDPYYSGFNDLLWNDHHSSVESGDCNGHNTTVYGGN